MVKPPFFNKINDVPNAVQQTKVRIIHPQISNHEVGREISIYIELRTLSRAKVQHCGIIVSIIINYCDVNQENIGSYVSSFLAGHRDPITYSIVGDGVLTQSRGYRATIICSLSYT